MKSQKSINRKASKAKARRKDYKKKYNIFHQNVPSSKKLKGVSSYPLLKQGDGTLPTSKKYRKSKKEINENRELVINTIASRKATARK